MGSDRMRETVAAPFDLTNGPLVRARLYRPQPAQQGTPRFARSSSVSTTSSSTAGHSDVFLKEFAALYPALQNGAEPSLPPLPAAICRLCGLAA